MNTLDHHEYVEYGEEWDGEADIKDNLRLQCFQRNIEAKVKKECTKVLLNVSWIDDEVVMPMEDSLFLRCHQFLKDESKPDDEEEENLVKVSRWRGGGRSCRRQRREEVGRICLRRKEDGGFEIKKEMVEEVPNADINHHHLVFGVDNCDVCPACQEQLRPSMANLMVNVSTGELRTRCDACCIDISIAGLKPREDG